MKTYKHSISAVIIEHPHSLTIEEFCRAIHIRREMVVEMVEYQIIAPEGEEKPPENWRFDSASLKRGRIAASFYQDLEINLPGVALALELLDKIEGLQNPEEK